MKKPKITHFANGFSGRSHNRRMLLVESPKEEGAFLLEFNTFHGHEAKTADTSYKRGINTTRIKLSTLAIEMIVQGYMEYLKNKSKQK